jgi:hypothetical protein
LSGNQVPVEERGLELKLAGLAVHNLLGQDGEPLIDKIEDIVFDTVVKAEVFKTSERKKTAITRTSLTRAVVPNMPGPGDYGETDDPDAAQWAWDSINSSVWRMCDANAGGRIQSRLNGEHALILCRTMATSEKGVQGVYVTRDWACIKADWITPDQQKVERAINRQARNGELGSERLPEHAKKIRRELNATTKAVLSAGVARIDRMIEAGDSGGDDSDDESEDA